MRRIGLPWGSNCNIRTRRHHHYSYCRVQREFRKNGRLVEVLELTQQQGKKIPDGLFLSERGIPYFVLGSEVCHHDRHARMKKYDSGIPNDLTCET